MINVNGWYIMHVNTFIYLKQGNITRNENISLTCVRRLIRIGPNINRGLRNLIDESCTNARNEIEDEIEEVSRLYSEIFDGNLNGAVNFEVTYDPNDVRNFSFISIFPDGQRQQYPVNIKGC
jgi:hypothetical protein